MISASRAYSYFRDNYVLKPSTNNWFSFDCPHCGKSMKAAVHFDYEQVKCWVCNYKQGIVAFVSDVEGMKFREAIEFLWQYKESNIDIKALESVVVLREVSEVNLPYGYTSILSGTTSFAVRAREYLKGRGFNLEYLDSIGIGYVNKHYPVKKPEDKDLDYFGYIIIPFKNAGKLKYFIGRDFIGNYLRYKNPPVADYGIGKSELFFNEDGLNYSTAFITEGWACALTMGKNGAATMGISLSTYQKTKILNSDCERVVIIMDAGYYAQGIKMGIELMDHKEVYVVDLSKISTDKKKDPNDLGRGPVIDLIKKTPQLDLGLAMEVLIDN